MASNELTVLLLEDSQPDARYIEELFREIENFELTFNTEHYSELTLHHVTTLSDCKSELATKDVDVMLLDLNLPDSRGFETVDAVLSISEDIPVIVLTGLEIEQMGVRAIRRGVQDYLVKDELNPRLLSRTIKYALERKTREQTIQRNQNLLRQTELIGDVGGWELDVETNNLRLTAGTRDILKVSPEFFATCEEGLDFVHPADRADIENSLERCIETSDPFDVEFRVTTDNGETRWLRIHGEPMDEDGRVTTVRGAVRDITQSKERESKLANREQMLRELHNTTRGLLEAQTVEEIAEYIVECTAEILNIESVAVYAFDEDSGSLQPVPTAPAVGNVFEEETAIKPGTSLLWEPYRRSETKRYVNDDLDTIEPVTSRPWTELVSVPIGDHGILYAATVESGFDDVTIEMTEMLAANAETALARLSHERELSNVSSRLNEQETHIAEFEELMDAIHSIQQAVTISDTREEIETAVCEELTKTERIDFAWIGRPETTDIDITPTAWHGKHHGYLDATRLENSHQELPSIRAAREHAVVSIASTSSHVKDTQWAKEAISRNFQAVLSIPLIYEGVLYGILTVYSGQEGAFDGMYRELFGDIGSLLANSISITEERQFAQTDQFLELEFRITDSNYALQKLADESATRLRFDTTTEEFDDSIGLLLTVLEGEPADVLETVEQHTGFQAASIFGSADYNQLSVRVTKPTLISQIRKHGGRVIKSISDQSGSTVSIEVPSNVSSRPVIDSITSLYTDIELLSRRARTGEQSLQTGDLDSELTKRQLNILRSAYYGGYFEKPKQITGDDLAANFDISAPVVYGHIREAQRRILEFYFETRTDT